MMFLTTLLERITWKEGRTGEIVNADGCWGQFVITLLPLHSQGSYFGSDISSTACELNLFGKYY